MVTLFDDLSCLTTVTNVDEWFRELNKLAKKIGYAEVLFGVKESKESDNSQATILSSYPQEWREKYDKNRYADIDPTVRHSFQSNLPIVWSDGILTAREQAFFEEARMYELGKGITLPLHGPMGQKGMLSLKLGDQSDRDYSKTINEHLLNTLALRDFALETGIQILNQKAPRLEVNLTQREIEVMKWSAAGKTSWEIAKILSCSEANINFHFNNVRSKFSVSSRRLAIVRGIRMGLI